MVCGSRDVFVHTRAHIHTLTVALACSTGTEHRCFVLLGMRMERGHRTVCDFQCDGAHLHARALQSESAPHRQIGWITRASYLTFLTHAWLRPHSSSVELVGGSSAC